MSQHELGITFKTYADAANKSWEKAINTIINAGYAIDKVQTKITKALDGRTYNRLVVTATNGAEKITKTFNETGETIRETSSTINKSFDYGKLMWYLNWAKGFARSLWNIELKAIDFNETQEKFNVSIGTSIKQATLFQNKISEAIGTSKAEMMDYQSTFKNILGGLGDLTTKQAEETSQSLTKMALDYSSLFNVSQKSALNKFQAALTGSIMPIRRESGYDVSKNAVSQKALELGVDRTYNKLTETEKRLIRIMLLMEQMQNTGAFNDLARTIESPSNQLKVLKNQLQEVQIWLGNVFMGTLGAILPYINGFVMTLKELIKMFAIFVGYQPNTTGMADVLQESSDSASGLSDNIGSAGSGLDKATKKAKEFKKQLQGFDVLNVINTPTESTTGKTGGSGGGVSGIDPKILEGFKQYDSLLENVQMKATGIRDKIMDWLGFTKEVNAETGEVTWKLRDGYQRINAIVDLIKIIAGTTGLKLVAKMLEKIAKNLKNFKLPNLGGASNFLLNMGFLGKAMKNALDMMDDIQDIIKNGANFDNVVSLLSNFAGGLGSIEVLKGNKKLGGILILIEGIGKIAQGIKDFVTADNWEERFKAAKTVIDGIGGVILAIGVLKQNYALIGTGFVLQGLTGIIDELQKNWDAIKNGDWSGVNKVKLAVASIEVLGGALPTIAGVIKKISSTKYSQKHIQDAKEAMQQTSDTLKDTSNKTTEIASGAEGVSTSTSTLTGKLKDLVKNMGLGLVAELEAVAAGLLLVGGIWAIGKVLTKALEAWQPILDNKEQTLETLGLGTALIGSVGVVTAGLGAVGTQLIVALGLGTAVLALAEADTLLLVGGIWLIGVALDKMQKAWQPVIKNQDNVTKALKKGTELLFAVGLATAALGALSIASVGLLPLAIAAGTAMLNQVTNATIQFVRNLAKVADELLNVLLPKLRDFNRQMPELNRYQQDFNDFMGKFAKYSWDFAGNTFMASLANTVTTIIKFFAGDPIKKYSNQVEKTDNSVNDLKDKLWNANRDLILAIKYLTDYNNLVNWLSSLVGSSVSFRDARGIYINLKSVGSNIVWGLSDGINDNIWQFRNAISNINNALRFDNWSAYNSGYEFGKSIANGVNNGVKWNLKSTIKAIDTSNWSTAKQYKIYAYANGGFPDMGQMFVARENGAEMVGRIGNRTAVANNDQIVQAVSQGVANAVSKVLGTQGGSYNLYIDGEQITNVVQKRTSSRENIFGY